MDFELQYWHWLVFGMLLVAGEIFVPSFTILWFGLGALLVGLLTLLMDLNFPAQILIWTISSVFFTVLWFKYFKPKMIDKTSAGITRDAAIGEAGQVIKAPTEHSRARCDLLPRYWEMMSGTLSVTAKLPWVIGFISGRSLAIH